MVKVNGQKLAELITKIFTGNGLSQEDAAIISGALVDANLTGRASHGVLRTKAYVERIQKGGANTSPNIRVLSETGATALIDGDNALGMLVAHRASLLTREKAEKNSIACVTVKNSNHYGAAAAWTDMMAQDDMIAFCCSNTAPLMAPPGGRDVALGTNPLCVTVPTASYGNVCLDIATSMVAQGKLFDYRLKHQRLPDGWAVDEMGLPTNDPETAAFLVPFAAHKGYGIAVMIEIMSALLAGGAFGKEINDMYRDVEKPNLISHCFIAIKISAFRDLGQFKADMDGFVDYLHSIPPVEGQRVYFPGEIEQLSRRKAAEDGLQLPEDLVAELTGLGIAAGIADAADYLR
ncbi:MAG: Ldh family oxidoreductase [Dysosmobacter sp.]|nr:Ldh family oxidoreductase [Dysosmobacter sp.]